MKRFVLALVLCGLAASAVPAFAQVQTQSSPPAAAPNEFTDPAMTFFAPDGYLKAPIPPHDPTHFDQATPVAAFVYHPAKQDSRVITISMENFQGSLSGYEMVVENNMRTQSDGVFFKEKKLTTLSNGMPAYWQDITVGSGFDTVKRYQYVWIDGVRGVQLAITARLGYLTEDQAKAALARASATAFPARDF